MDLTHKYAPPEILPDTLWSTEYTYNLDRQITRTLFPELDSIKVQYDTSGCNCGSLARPSRVSFDRGTLIFAYDSTTGNLKSVVAPGNDTLFYTYDGSLPLTARWSGHVNGTVAVRYDSSFRVIQQKVNGVDSIAYVYDNDGLLTIAGNLKIKRDATNGLFLGDTLGNVATSVGYNSLGEMSSYLAKYGGSTLFSTSYTRDSLGRITTLNETIQGATTVNRYGYDLAGRLKQVWRNDTLQATYFYDPNGNRDSVVTPTGTTRGTYDGQDRMLAYGSASYFYTKRGSLSMKVDAGDTTRYTYDLLGNLTKVVLPNGSVIEYLIDAQNRRVGKKLNGTIVARWIYSGQLSPVAELDSSGSIVARYVYATHVNVPDYIVKSGATYRVVTDHLGSVRLVVNQATGTVAQRMDYDAWGNVTTDSNPGFTPFGFAGGLYEAQTKLVRFGERDYVASIGHWTSKDPIGFLGGQENLYSYIDGLPNLSTDPMGLWGPEVHDLMMAHALGNKVPSTWLKILIREGRFFDNTTQDQGESYKHAMADVDDTPKGAQGKTQEFECGTLKAARYYAGKGETDLALYFLAHAIHPMMDQTSPAHTDDAGNPIIWKGMFSWGALEHAPFVGREKMSDLTSGVLSKTDFMINTAYSYVFGR